MDSSDAPQHEPAVQRALQQARLLALDVDGTLTDGRVVYAGKDEAQHFDVRDGQGLAWLRRSEIAISWITGRGCTATERRAEELGVKELHLRAGPKDDVLRGVQSRLGIGPDETIVMGDDLPDLAMKRAAALLCAPADADPRVRARAGLVTKARAGHGAVREVAEAILRAKGLLDSILGRYLDEDA